MSLHLWHSTPNSLSHISRVSFQTKYSQFKALSSWLRNFAHLENAKNNAICVFTVMVYQLDALKYVLCAAHANSMGSELWGILPPPLRAMGDFAPTPQS